MNISNPLFLRSLVLGLYHEWGVFFFVFFCFFFIYKFYFIFIFNV